MPYSQLTCEQASELLGPYNDDDLPTEARLRVEGPKRAQTFSWPEHARTVLKIYQSLLA